MREISLYTDNVMKDMGRRIQLERRKRGFKAIDFADIIGIGKDQLSRIENGKVACKIEYVYVITQILQVSADYILFGRMENDNDMIYALSTMSNAQKNKLRKLIQILIEN